jgi:hypothetical protein
MRAAMAFLVSMLCVVKLRGVLGLGGAFLLRGGSHQAVVHGFECVLDAIILFIRTASIFLINPLNLNLFSTLSHDCVGALPQDNARGLEA